MTIGGGDIHTITSKIGKLFYGFSSRLLDYFELKALLLCYSLVSDLILKYIQWKIRKSYYNYQYYKRLINQ